MAFIGYTLFQVPALRCAENKSALYMPGTGEVPRKAPIQLRAGPHLFLDEWLIESSSNISRRFNVPRRDAAIPNPIVTGKGHGCFQPYHSILFRFECRDSRHDFVRDLLINFFQAWFGTGFGLRPQGFEIQWFSKFHRNMPRTRETAMTPPGLIRSEHSDRHYGRVGFNHRQPNARARGEEVPVLGAGAFRKKDDALAGQQAIQDRL